MTQHRARRCAVWLILMSTVAMSSAAVSAQGAAVQKRLASATRLTCAFAAVATAAWKDGVPAVEAGAATMKVAFRNVNVDEGTAEAEGNFGAGLIVVRYTTDYLHLMEMQGAGPLYVTTVLARETKSGGLLAVHTRHEYTDVRLPGFTSRPEMYVGECALGE